MASFLNIVELFARHKVRPVVYPCIEDGGVPVGPEIKFEHFAPLGKMHRELRTNHMCRLAAVGADAFIYRGSEAMGGGISIGTIQPIHR